ncbi:hypothetical protein GGI23_000177 [Coemansia sp. RSA 2559]|nr:hypothetical protein GGI23_000177 [Coemansia sp. RSA 2559]KAJ2869533.1 hypothetical protein GGI22_000194 [Coemansia erecta]
MDDFAIRLAADAAEAENSSGSPTGETSDPKTTAETKEQEGPTFGSMFGFAASWGKRLQDELHLDQLVDQVKKQSEEVTQAYRDDIAEFAQAVRVGATRGMDELSTRFGQIKAELGAEIQSNKESQDGSAESMEEEQQQQQRGASGSSAGLLQGLGRHFQMDALRQRQEKAKRLVDKLGTNLEDLLRDAIVIEAPGSASTEEQRSAARKIIYDRRMAQLAAIQESEETYLVDPKTTNADKTNNGLSFAAFIKDFDLESKQKEEDVASLLKDNPAMAELHKTLVPEKIEDSVFWTRYFFHAWLVDQEEARRKKLVEAAVAATEEDQFSWDLDEESDTEGPSKKEKKEAKDLAPSTDELTEDGDAKAEKSPEADVEKTQQDTPNDKPAAKARKGTNDNDDEAWGEWE